jgi:uncharacterized protein (TIGR04141 family)
VIDIRTLRTFRVGFLADPRIAQERELSGRISIDGERKANMEHRLQALTIFLLRELKDPIKALKSAGRLRRIEIDANHTVFIKRTSAHPPTWTQFFADRVDSESFGKVKSSGAVLLCIAANRHFAVVFGTGRYLLDPLSIEQRFGLLVTLNAVDPKRVRSIDKASLDRQGMQSRIQASRDSTAKDFGLDIEQDLVRAVAGTPIDGQLGETIAGFDSLHVAARIGFEDLREHLAIYLKQSKETLYQKEFGWIDHVREVRDSNLKTQLHRQLVKDIKTAGAQQCWMAPDGIIDWNEVSYFQFGMGKNAPQFSNLTLERFIEHIGGLSELTPDTLETGLVRAIRADESTAHVWSAARCLQAETQFNQKSYLLSAGKWYQVDDDFVAAVNSIVGAIPICDMGLPEYRDLTEGKYNERVADNSRERFALVDADNVRHGGGRSQIEFCDLYSRDRDMIHVKRYSGSSVLSHLFSQAAVSGELFKSDAEFRKKVNAKLPATHQIPDVRAPVEQSQYRIVIAIVGGPGVCTKLPFFSRVTIKNSYRHLAAYGYRVAVSHVPLEARYAQLSTIREKTTRKQRTGRKRRRA